MKTIVPSLNSQPAPRKVWILMFDQLQIHGADPISIPTVEGELRSAGTEQFNAFDDLDLGCCFFEQHILQDSRASAKITDVVGGQHAMELFMGRLGEEKKSSGRVRIGCMNPSQDEEDAELPWNAEPEDSAGLPKQIVRQLALGAGDVVNLPDPDLLSTLSADVVWIEAQSFYDRRSNTAEKMLEFVQQCRLASRTDTSGLPVLIVSAIHGYARTVNSPFTTGLSESLIHVPLWIDQGTGHSCRIQSLTGSFDLLPTVLDFLLNRSNDAEQTESKPPSSSTPSDELKGTPLSLAAVCSHNKPLPDRLLRLTGESWTALRTQQYLLVQPNTPETSSDETLHSSIDSMRSTRALYLKPDDVWNVNDSIVAYSAIADQMETTAARSHCSDK